MFRMSLAFSSMLLPFDISVSRHYGWLSYKDYIVPLSAGFDHGFHLCFVCVIAFRSFRLHPFVWQVSMLSVRLLQLIRVCRAYRCLFDDRYEKLSLLVWFFYGYGELWLW